MDKILTIKQLNNYIKGVFEDEIILHDVTVCGEIFEFKIAGNNTFIILKDEDSILSCYKFGVIEKMQVGAKVRVTGKINFHPNSGKVSLVIKKAEYDGEGEQKQALLKLKQQLAAEGLCGGRKLPYLIKKVILITSAEGAVLHDFVTVIGESDFRPEILIYPVRVQGSDAVETVIKALDKANAEGADLIVIARGGGSQTDLECFNNEVLARKVNASVIPVLSAIGHEIDYTLCDFCAAARAGTPSIAAQMVSEINRTAANGLFILMEKMKDSMKRISEFAHRSAEIRINGLYRTGFSSLNRLKERVLKCCFSLRKAEFISNRETKLYNNIMAIRKEIESCEKNAEITLSVQTTRLDLLSPLKVIAQGYAKLKHEEKEINDLSEVKTGDSVKIIMRDGTADAEIKKIFERESKNDF